MTKIRDAEVVDHRRLAPLYSGPLLTTPILALRCREREPSTPSTKIKWAPIARLAETESQIRGGLEGKSRRVARIAGDGFKFAYCEYGKA